MTVERIEQLKDMHLSTDLGDAAVLAPEDSAWSGAAERLAALLGAATGATVPVQAGGNVAGSLDQLRDRHLVVLGHCHVNPAIMALYRRQFAFVDEAYPGGDGYTLRTVHNPGNRGHNVVLVGASAPEGAAGAIDRLEEVLGRGGASSRGAVLPYTNRAVSECHAGLLPSFGPEEFARQTEQAFGGNAGRGPIERGVTLGLAHHLTGDADCARMFRDVLFYYEDQVHQQHGGEWCFEHMLFIYAWTWRLFYVWDLIEESDAFTDAERLRLTNLLWGLAHYVAGLSYFGGKVPAPGIRQNHWTFAALSMSFAVEYFRTYYGVEAFGRELEICRAIFDGQATCYKPNDDGGGGGYCWLVPDHQLIYDLRRDDTRFADGGHLRQLADYALLITDNLGSTVNFGDCGTYGRRRAASAGIASTLTRAAAFYDAGEYLWALDWMGGTPGLQGYCRDLPRNEPTQATGVCVAPLTQPLHDWAAANAPGGANIPAERAFDKLALREGFSEDDLYLLLDGTSTFAHGHDDGNSIERLTWKGRMWLAETDYIWRRPRFHSTVVSICDGESREPPALTALDWAADLGPAALTRTRLDGYNGVDWSRDLIWARGDFLLAVDSLHLREEADYDLRCLWRVIGDAGLAGQELTASQQGVYFRLAGAGDGDCVALQAEEPRVAGLDPYETYDYAGGPTSVLIQRHTRAGRPGEVVRYFNLMAAGSQDEVADCRLRRVAANAVVVRSAAATCLAGAGPEPVGIDAGEGDAVMVEAGAFLVSGESLVAVAATRCDVGPVRLAADEPVEVCLQLSEGAGRITAAGETRLTLAGLEGLSIDGEAADGEVGGPVVLRSGEHTVAFVPTVIDVVESACRALTYEPPEPAARAHLPGPMPASGAGFQSRQVPASRWETRVGGAVTALDVNDATIAAGTRSGEVVAMDPDGRVRWRAEAGTESGAEGAAENGAAVRAVRTTSLVDGGVLAGGRDCALTLYDRAGEVVWQRPFGVSHGRPQCVNDVQVADLDGSGAPRVVVATDGWLVWALTASGEEVWQRQIEHHAAGSLAIADVDGDGHAEILVGTEYYNSNLLEADGRIRWTVRAGPGFNALGLVDVDGDGVLEAVYGSLDGSLYVVDSATGATRWTANLGDEVRFCVPLAGTDGLDLVAGSDSGNLCRLSPTGERRWRLDLDAPVTGLVDLGCPGGRSSEARLAVATASGEAALVSAQGEVLAAAPQGAAVTAMKAGGATLLVGTASGAVRAIEVEPHGSGTQ